MTDLVMTTDMLSESEARQLLNDVQSFRRDWAQFAVHSREQFDGFRDRGDSLPESFFRRYAELQQGKELLARQITERTLHAQRVDWQPPRPMDSLHDFETRLLDLIEVCRELDRIAQEKYQHSMSILNEVLSLRCVDLELNQPLQSLQQAAMAECLQLGPRAVRLADLDLEAYINDCESLLQLIREACARRAPEAVPESGLNAAQCLQKFQVVAARFGLPIAVEALHGGLRAPAISAGSRLDHSQSVLGKSVAVGSETSLNSCPIVSVSIQEETRPATREAIEQLIASQSSGGSIFSGGGMIAAKRTPSVPARGPERIRVSDLKRAAEQLERDIEALKEQTGVGSRFDGTEDQLKVRMQGFKNLADALRIAVEFYGDPQPESEIDKQQERNFLQLMAEAQSAVRVEAIHAGISVIEAQCVAFNWLRQECSPEARGIMVHRYMKLEDHAEPASFANLARHLLKCRRLLDETRNRARAVRGLRKACNRLLQKADQYDEVEHPEAWRQIDQFLVQLVQGGLKFNDTGLREILLPVFDYLPESVLLADEQSEHDDEKFSGEFRQVAASLVEFVETAGAQVQAEPDEEEELSPQVARACELLRGKILVIVGGVRKAHAEDRLKRALQLRDVRWLTARKQDKVSSFRSQLVGAAVVILLTKVIGHKHNDVREMCRELEIPWAQTRVNCGYSVNRIATVILEQVSEQLSGQVAEQVI